MSAAAITPVCRPGGCRAVQTNVGIMRSRLFAKRGERPHAGYLAVLFSGRPDLLAESHVSLQEEASDGFGAAVNP